MKHVLDHVRSLPLPLPITWWLDFDLCIAGDPHQLPGGPWSDSELDTLSFLVAATEAGINLDVALLEDDERVVCRADNGGVYGHWLNGHGWILTEVAMSTEISKTLNEESVTLSTVWRRAEELSA